MLNLSTSRLPYFAAVFVLIMVIAIAVYLGRSRSAHQISVPYSPPVFASETMSTDLRDDIAVAIDRFASLHVEQLGKLFHRWRLIAVNASPKANDTLDAEMLRVLSHEEFRRVYTDSPDLFLASPAGVRVRATSRQLVHGEWQGEPHIDQLLATFAETRLPIDTAISTAGGIETVASLLDASRLNFTRDQETYWSIIAYCSYRPEEDEWTNRFGDQMSYEQVAEDLLEGDMAEGACGGTHRLMALSYLLACDAEAGNVLSSRCCRRVRRHFRRVSEALENCQLPNGAWPITWGRSSRDANVSLHSDETLDWLHMTGHHLEWMAYVQPELRSRDASLAAAARFILSAHRQADLAQMDRHYGIFSHGLRALVLLERADAKR